MTKELAQVMFDAYNAQGPNPGKTWDGKDVPPFEECGPQVQAKWRAAAVAAVSAQGIKGPTHIKAQPSVCRTVLYKLSVENVEQINRRRTTGAAIYDRIKQEKWPLGAQAHIGNAASVGEEFPLVITKVWPDEFGPGIPGVNGQVLLDGNDQFWVTSVGEGGDPGQWSWPPRS